jgi:hypothetical protein
VDEDKLIRAARDFLRLNRDYADTQANFDLMHWVIEREKLDPSSVSNLSTAWSRAKVITRNDALRLGRYISRTRSKRSL